MTERTMVVSSGPSEAEPVRVLIVDGGAPDLRDTVAVLREQGFECDTVVDGAALVRRAASSRPQVILFDAHAGSTSGTEVLQHLQADHRTALIPVICVTSDRRPETVLELLAGGADDCVVKPFDPNELRARILVATRRRTLLGGISPLTGLPGNVLLTRILQQRLDQGVPFAFLQVDIDNFKAFNDRYGYIRGDDVIAAVAVLLEEAVERVDGAQVVLGHIGGDDFGVLAPIGQARAIAERVTEGFDRIVPRFYDPDDVAQGRIALVGRTGATRHYPLMSVSIGVAVWTPEHPPSAEAVADAAAEMKRVAKRHEGSYVAVDRRRPGGPSLS